MAAPNNILTSGGSFEIFSVSNLRRKGRPTRVSDPGFEIISLIGCYFGSTKRKTRRLHDILYKQS